MLVLAIFKALILIQNLQALAIISENFSKLDFKCPASVTPSVLTTDARQNAQQ